MKPLLAIVGAVVLVLVVAVVALVIIARVTGFTIRPH